MTTTTRNCWCTEASMLRRWVSVLVRVTSSTTDHTHHGRSNQSPLAPFPRDSAVQDGRAYVQSLAWICADIPESTSSCCRSTQSSLSLARRSVRTSRLQVMPVRLSTVGGQAFSVSGPTSRQRLRNFFFPISFIIRHYSGLPVLSFITVSGSWSDFYLILGPIFKKMTDWLIDRLNAAKIKVMLFRLRCIITTTPVDCFIAGYRLHRHTTSRCRPRPWRFVGPRTDDEAAC